MKTIEIGAKKVTLDVGDELRVKDMRRIAPVLSEFFGKEGKEMDMVVWLVSVLSSEPETDVATVDGMTIAEFAQLAQKMGEILDVEKKTGNSSPDTPAKP